MVPTPNTPSTSLYLIVSLGLHILGLTFFTVFSPKMIQPAQTLITVNLSGVSRPSKKKLSLPRPAQKKTIAEIPKSAPLEKSITKLDVKKTVAEKTLVEIPKPTPLKVVSEKTIAIPVPLRKNVIKPKAQNTIVPKTPIPAPRVKHVQTPQPKKIPTQNSQAQKQKNISKELESLLDKKTASKAKPTTDVLADAQWSGTPRKTISFPNLTAAIPQQYRSKGYGFSVTAKIIFNPQGWVSAVELIHPSGDPRIDSIFRTELRKIRIEASKKRNYDTITKTFNFSVK